MPKRRFTDEQEAEIAVRYLAGESTVKLAASVSSNPPTIMAALQRQNVKRRGTADHVKKSDDESLRIVENYANGMKKTEFMNISIDWRTVEKYAKKYLKEHSETALAEKVRHRMYHLRARFMEKTTENIYSSMFKNWRAGAVARKIPFEITIQDVDKLYKKQNGLCAYTGCKMLCPNDLESFRIAANSIYKVSLDRIDSSIGYTPENICLCIGSMNLAKNDWSKEEFQQVIRKIAINLAPIPCASDSMPLTFGLFSNLG